MLNEEISESSQVIKSIDISVFKQDLVLFLDMVENITFWSSDGHFCDPYLMNFMFSANYR